MQKEAILLTIALLFIAACQPPTIPAPLSEPSPDDKTVTKITTQTPEEGLGTLCSSQEECRTFCSTNRGRCESFCRGKELGLCRIIFPPPAGDPGHQDNRGCTGTGTVTFTSPPMDIEDINFIEPIGLMIGGHVTPIDHGYYTAKTWQPGTPRKADDFVDIRAPAAGIVTSVESMPAEYASSTIGDYRLVIHHTCSFYTIYIHVNQLSEKLQGIAGKGKQVSVDAGEAIGKAPGFDFSVHHDEITLPGFIVPETYAAEPWKIHTVDMFDHFAEPIKKQLLDKNIRQIEPRGGKIDYDIDGKLVGNWFEENTNGYYGKEEYHRSAGYWSTQVAFAYDGLDPNLIVVSIGDFAGEARQFAVKGNAPDPAEVSSESGLIKYELVFYEYLTASGEYWDRLGFAPIASAQGMPDVRGVVLVQMLEDRKIKFESFPGKNANQVTVFTDNVKIYER